MTPVELEILTNAFDKAKAACDSLQSAEPSAAVDFAKNALAGCISEARRRIEAEFGPF